MSISDVIQQDDFIAFISTYVTIAMISKPTLLVIAIAIVLILMCIAGYYLYAVQQQENRLRLEKQKKREEGAAAISRTRRSIELLVQFAEQGQLDLAEAAIRISGLLSAVGYTKDADHFAAFYGLAEACAYMPILDKWKALDSATKKRFTKEREALEAQWKERMQEAYVAVRNHPDFFVG